MDDLEILGRFVQLIIAAVVILGGGGGGLKIRGAFNKLNEERKADQEVATQQAGLITALQDTVDDFLTELQTVRGEKNRLAEDLQAAIKTIGDQKLTIETGQRAFDALQRRFNVQESVVDELLPLAGQVEILKSKIESLEKELEAEREKRIEAERQRAELKEKLRREREEAAKQIAALEESANLLARTFDTQEKQIKDLRELVDTLTTPPPDPPLTIVDPNKTPKDEDADQLAS
jgi:chromosome segregation ATPase